MSPNLNVISYPIPHQCNNVLLMAVTKRNSNVALILFFLYKLTTVSSLFNGRLYSHEIFRSLKITSVNLRKRVSEITLLLSMNFLTKLWTLVILKLASPRF